MESNKLKIFSYGSLMNHESLRKTIPEAEILGIDTVTGYRRLFNFKSPYRHNTKTGVYSSVLNVESEENIEIIGVVFTVPKEKTSPLFYRERGYGLIELETKSGESVNFFMATDNEPYWFVQNDPIQTEYLQLCLDSVKLEGKGMYDNFLDTTYVQDSKTVREQLVENAKRLYFNKK